MIATEQDLKRLTSLQRTIIKLRHGIGACGPYSIANTARILRITPGRVRWIQAKAEKKLGESA